MEVVVRKVSFYNNPFVGLFFRASDDFALVPRNSPAKLVAAAEEAFRVPVHAAFVNQSPLVGLYTALNSNGCVLPSFAGKEDVALMKKLGVNVFLLDEHAACGNNVLANDRAAMVNPRISWKSAKGISECLGVEVFQQQSLSGVHTFGSANVVTSRGLLAFNDTPEAELKRMENIFQVKGGTGTANFGSQYCGTSIVANKNGALAGDKTSGFELQRAYEALFG